MIARAFAVLMIGVAAVVFAAPFFRAPDGGDHAAHTSATHSHGGSVDPLSGIALGANALVIAGIVVLELKRRRVQTRPAGLK